MNSTSLDAYQKAQAINRDSKWYGTLAEIGAGQETARWLFQAGGAAGSIAKTISAYDMAFSDAIYGKCQRYVSRERLVQMLDHEYQLLKQRLGQEHSGKRYFVFANTVAARSHKHHGEGRGWLGVRFQLTPTDAPSEIHAHVRLLDWDNAQQQQALGLVGLNLIYGAYAMAQQPQQLIASLMDGLNPQRLEVDMIRFAGPVANGVDNRLMSVELVRQGLTEAAMFSREGDSIELADALYHKPVLMLRGSFRPVTRTIMSMLERAQKKFVKSLDPDAGEPVVVTEMNLSEIEEQRDSDAYAEDLLARMTMLQELGQEVLISGFREHFHVVELLRRYTKAPMALVMGAPTLELILDPAGYAELDGGILEAAGRLFKNNVRAYVYPYQRSNAEQLITLQQIQPAAPVAILFDYLRATGAIVDVEPLPGEDLSVFPDDVRDMIRCGDRRWENVVPESVAEAIKRGNLFGYQRAPQTAAREAKT